MRSGEVKDRIWEFCSEVFGRKERFAQLPAEPKSQFQNPPKVHFFAPAALLDAYSHYDTIFDGAAGENFEKIIVSIAISL